MLLGVYEFLREALEAGDITKAGRLMFRINEAVANVPIANLHDRPARQSEASLATAPESVQSGIESNDGCASTSSKVVVFRVP